MAKRAKPASSNAQKSKSFHLEFKNVAQKMAWAAFQSHDILFMLGSAGTGKSHLSVAFAVNEILAKRKDKIIITRPIVEAGESLGFLPGEIDAKVAPYMTPIFDCLTKMLGPNHSSARDLIEGCIEVRPLAYMRGTAQPIDAKIVTPTGLVEMGDLLVGDEVIGSDGKPTKVLGIYPQGFKETYEVTFLDGAKTQCCGEHLWATQTLSEKRHDKGYTVKDTLKIKETLKTRHNQKNHKVPILSSPVQFEKQEVLIEPYLLGLLLGDGNFHATAGVKFTTSDTEFVDPMNRILERQNLHLIHRKGYDYSIVKIDRSGKAKNLLKSAVIEMGLMGKLSYQKSIPPEYLFNDVETRISLLQGLIDTDGWVGFHRSGNNRVQYYTTSEKLADNVIFLVQSLGGTSTKVRKPVNKTRLSWVKGRPVRSQRDCFVLDISLPSGITPCRLSRKKDRYKVSPTPKRLIASIEPVGKRFCQCIRVAAEDHLYLTDGCILTHNTFSDAVCLFDEAQNATYGQLKLFMTRIGENTKMIINGDPHQSDLHGPIALADVVDKLQTVEGIGTIKFGDESIVRNPIISKILAKI